MFGKNQLKGALVVFTMLSATLSAQVTTNKSWKYFKSYTTLGAPWSEGKTCRAYTEKKVGEFNYSFQLVVSADKKVAPVLLIVTNNKQLNDNVTATISSNSKKLFFKQNDELNSAFPEQTVYWYLPKDFYSQYLDLRAKDTIEVTVAEKQADGKIKNKYLSFSLGGSSEAIENSFKLCAQNDWNENSSFFRLISKAKADGAITGSTKDLWDEQAEAFNQLAQKENFANMIPAQKKLVTEALAINNAINGVLKSKENEQNTLNSNLFSLKQTLTSKEKALPIIVERIKTLDKDYAKSQGIYNSKKDFFEKIFAAFEQTNEAVAEKQAIYQEEQAREKFNTASSELVDAQAKVANTNQSISSIVAAKTNAQSRKNATELAVNKLQGKINGGFNVNDEITKRKNLNEDISQHNASIKRIENRIKTIQNIEMVKLNYYRMDVNNRINTVDQKILQARNDFSNCIRQEREREERERYDREVADAHANGRPTPQRPSPSNRNDNWNDDRNRNGNNSNNTNHSNRRREMGDDENDRWMDHRGPGTGNSSHACYRYRTQLSRFFSEKQELVNLDNQYWQTMENLNLELVQINNEQTERSIAIDAIGKDIERKVYAEFENIKRDYSQKLEDLSDINQEIIDLQSQLEQQYAVLAQFNANLTNKEARLEVARENHQRAIREKGNAVAVANEIRRELKYNEAYADYNDAYQDMNQIQNSLTSSQNEKSATEATIAQSKSEIAKIEMRLPVLAKEILFEKSKSESAQQDLKFKSDNLAISEKGFQDSLAEFNISAKKIQGLLITLNK